MSTTTAESERIDKLCEPGPLTVDRIRLILEAYCGKLGAENGWRLRFFMESCVGETMEVLLAEIDRLKAQLQPQSVSP